MVINTAKSSTGIWNTEHSYQGLNMIQENSSELQIQKNIFYFKEIIILY